MEKRPKKDANKGHKDIRAVLLARIMNGVWRPGDALPSDQELAADFGCARLTVARAMNTLAEAGLVQRRRKAGTRVNKRQSRDFVIGISLVRQDVEASGAAYRYELLSRRIVAPPVAVRRALGLAAKQQALHLICRHFADKRPYQLEDRWINLQTLPPAAEQNFRDTNPNEWLINEVPYSRAKHILRAEACGEKEADLLGLTTSQPVFVIERTTVLLENSVTFVRLTHPGEHFSLTSEDTGI
jgi:GntR family histidine utilization transcriptional repressor